MLYKIAFSRVKGNNPQMAAKIIEMLGSEKEFFTLSEMTLAGKLGFRGRILTDDYRHEVLRKAEAELPFIADNGIRTLYYTDKDYPRRLLECDDAPLMLFALGNANLNATHVVSIVGTRNATVYGVNFINRLVDDLSQKIDDLLVVSGLAMGCDIAAHRKALEMGIPTVGVVAHGLDTLYPSEHRNHAAAMVRQGGAIVTDYLHGTQPHRSNFLARNRIVAGMADAVVVAGAHIRPFQPRMQQADKDQCGTSRRVGRRHHRNPRLETAPRRRLPAEAFPRTDRRATVDYRLHNPQR